MYVAILSVIIILLGHLLDYIATGILREEEIGAFFQTYQYLMIDKFETLSPLWRNVTFFSLLGLMIILLLWALGWRMFKIFATTVLLIVLFLRLFIPVEEILIKQFQNNFGTMLFWLIVYTAIAMNFSVQVRFGLSIAYVVFSFTLISLLICGLFYSIIVNPEIVHMAKEIYQGEMRYSFLMLSQYLKILVVALILGVIFVNVYALFRGWQYYFHRRKVTNNRVAIKWEELPHIGINIPAYNEEDVIIPTIESVLKAIYPAEKKHILVISDGSKDRTEELVIKTYQMFQVNKHEPIIPTISTQHIFSIWQSPIYPNLRLIVKANGKKHDALNAGLIYQPEYVEYVMNIDADTKIEESSLMTLASEILSDPYISAVAGMVRPEYNPVREKGSFVKKIRKWTAKMLVKWQQVDYYTAFHINRGGLSQMNALTIVSGAFGLFDRMALVTVKGYSKGLGEDMSMTLKLQDLHKYYTKHKRHGRIVFVPEAIAYTAAPLTLRDLSTQRQRWFKGMLECLGQFYKLAFTRRMFYAFLQLFVLELLTPLLIPIGIMMIWFVPETIESTIFQVSLGIAILTAIANSISAIWIESQYRLVKRNEYFSIFLQFIIFIFTVIWRNDAFIQYRDKRWGSIKKRFE